MLKGLDLSNQFLGVAPNLGRQHFHCTDDEIRVDDEPTTNIDAGSLIVHAINLADLSACIRKHREGHAPLYHLGQLLLLPDLVDKATICTQGQHFYIKRLEFCIAGGDRRQFSRSNKGEGSWEEAKHNPLASVVRKLNRLKPYSFNETIYLEIYCFFPNLRSHHDLR